ncbi:hypothetical protein [Marinobacter sp. CA1]|uniref:hypothetical protein n=1 Tax=Marinobacter sp. CA1 TaxID=2817656 RepID=UPI001D0898A3|nr:hypothetical protein [Marinobacter sp. CA1]UDL05225.1 hypothetical protein J2887_00065 [Marinobacter sp. CA1]
MTFPRLHLHSERYSVNGNLSADGFRKLLGTPTLDLLQTVVRESVQNSCDAADDDHVPKVVFRLRTLSQSQSEALDSAFTQFPGPEASGAAIRDFAATEKKWVLEICDFGTGGLGGPTRADQLPGPEESTDFVDFMRNVGTRRDTYQGGGSYGYGKTSLYLSSACSTILVDSQTTNKGADVRRFMGCHLGSAFSAPSEAGGQIKYTGRHWWGTPGDNDDYVDPVEGSEAEVIAERLGFLQRGPEERGTSIMILDPLFMRFEDTDPRVTAGLIAETLLWFFWPRLLETQHSPPSLNLAVEFEGEEVSVPRPQDYPPLNLFARAMRKIKDNEEDSQQVYSPRYNQVLGDLAIHKGPRAERTPIVPENKSIIPKQCAHIAVMRPVELVVRYFEGDPFSNANAEWAGVFVAGNDEEVEEAFASAEPPSHDDWLPNMLPKGKHQSYVNIALRRIKEKAKQVAHSSHTISEHESDKEPLGLVAKAMGTFLSGASTSPLPQASGGRKKGKVAPSVSYVQWASFKKLEAGRNGRVIALFSADVPHIKGDAIIGTATHFLVVDGKPLPKEDENLGRHSVAILSWKSRDGHFYGEGHEVELDGNASDVQIRVEIPTDMAVRLKIEFGEKELD